MLYYEGKRGLRSIQLFEEEIFRSIPEEVHGVKCTWTRNIARLAKVAYTVELVAD